MSTLKYNLANRCSLLPQRDEFSNHYHLPSLDLSSMFDGDIRLVPEMTRRQDAQSGIVLKSKKQKAKLIVTN